MSIIPHMHIPPGMKTSPEDRLALLRAARAPLCAVALLSTLALTSGCVVAVRPAPAAVVYPGPEEVVVTEAPPAPPVEYVGASPGPGFIWIRGYYHWYGGRWVWYRGHYERPPRVGAVWVGPRYEVRGGTRIYVRGYWR
jgi:hypothetical protein